jgi:two-component system OmpR family response regulator
MFIDSARTAVTMCATPGQKFEEQTVRILVIEDDAQVAGYVRKGLLELGNTVDVAADGREGLMMATSAPYDVLIVDRMLPYVDGMAIVRTLRDSDIKAPILFLSALGEVEDRVRGLEAGADDYLTKPFAFSELKARLDALVRRGGAAGSTVTELTVSDLHMDLMTRQVTRAGQSIELQPREFRLLEFLMRHAGQVVTRTMLLEHVWDYHFDPQTNVIDVHVSRLRRKIDKDFDTPLLHTVRGAGYRLE